MVVRRYREPEASPPGSAGARTLAGRRGGTLRLFLPSLALGLLFLALSAFWLWASWRTGAEIDRFLAREAASGRVWTCPDRSVGGYPFRIEVTCTRPSFEGRAEGREVSGGLARILAVAQVYNPNHVIVEATGPLTVRDSAGSELDVDWQLLQASVMTRQLSGLERFSLVLTAPKARVAGPGLAETAVSAASADLHVRPTPERAGEGAYDVASRITQASVPPLDQVLGGRDPADADVVVTVTRADALRGAGLPDELERWREAGGKLHLAKLTLAKGAKRLDAEGTLYIDDVRRAAGRLDLTVSGLDELLRSLGVGPRTAAIGGLIAGVLGGGKAKAAPPDGEDATGAGPGHGLVLPLRLDNGKAMLGPIRVGTLPPLY